MLATGRGRAATRGGGEVIELDCGITVYPARSGGGRWRAVWYEGGERQQCEAATEDRLAGKLEKVTERLRVGAPNMTKTGSDLIACYLDPDRLPVHRRWSRKHAHTQRRLCTRYAAPVIGAVTCQDIRTAHMQAIVNAAPTASEGDRVRRMLSALVTAGIDAGYLANSRLVKVHWQAGDRPVPAPAVGVAGESAQWVGPAEIPSGGDIAKPGGALAAGVHGDRDELMASTAAYSGLRWGELIALTTGQVDQAARVITVDRKVAEVAGHLYLEAPKNRKHRRTIYPRRTPSGYPLAERLAVRVAEARAEQAAGANPLGLIFPSPTGKHWRSSNFNRNVLKRAYLAAGWRDSGGNGRWTWHSLRHVLCTTALFTWKLDATDVSRMAGDANYRVTLDMCVGTTAGVLDRARMARGWSHGLAGAAAAAWPAVALVGSYELLAWMIRTTAAGGPGHAPEGDHGVPQADQPGSSPRSAVSLVREAVPTAASGNGAGPASDGAQDRFPVASAAAPVRGPGPRGPAGPAGPGPATDTAPTGDVDAAAVAAYRASIREGGPLSERKLAQAFGRTSRRWARNRMAEARQRPAAA